MAGFGISILDHEVNLIMETKPVCHKLEGCHSILLKRERNLHLFFRLMLFCIFCQSLTNLLFFFHLFRAEPVAYAGSQVRGRIRAEGASLCHSHSNVRSEPHL